MAKSDNLQDFFTDLANNIRSMTSLDPFRKTITDGIKPNQMASRIDTDLSSYGGWYKYDLGTLGDAYYNITGFAGNAWELGMFPYRYQESGSANNCFLAHNDINVTSGNSGATLTYWTTGQGMSYDSYVPDCIQTYIVPVTSFTMTSGGTLTRSINLNIVKNNNTTSIKLATRYATGISGQGDYAILVMVLKKGNALYIAKHDFSWNILDY